MQLYVTQKTAGQRSNKALIETIVDITLPNEVSADTLTVAILLRALVAQQVADFNQAIATQQQQMQQNAAAHGSLSSVAQMPLTTVTIDDYLRSTGKVGFGHKANLTPANLEAATETALQAFIDGLFILFIDEQEVSQLNDIITLQDGSRLTFVRLTFLVGSFY
jgi:hypothetical protein